MIDSLSQFNLDKDPLITFLNWYHVAKEIEDNPEAMTLSTYNTQLARPESRTVLYKGIEDSHLLFYTNYLSHKGEQIARNKNVSLLFYWHKSIRQIKIQGEAIKVSNENSDRYFQSRDRESQLASYISNQSSPIESKEILLNKLNEAKLNFLNLSVPRPDHWGGYQIIPNEFEFFIYGKNRINDRFLYAKNEIGEWNISRLQP